MELEGTEHCYDFEHHHHLHEGLGCPSGKSPVTRWLEKGQQLLQAGPHKPCMSSVRLPGKKEKKLKVELLVPGSVKASSCAASLSLCCATWNCAPGKPNISKLCSKGLSDQLR